MDPATAKTLVSATLVASISLFSLISLQAFFAQIAADLRAARIPVRTDRRDKPQA